MNNLDLDAGLAAVVDFVREVHAPIALAIQFDKDGGGVTSADCAALSGAVSALLGAIDARLPQQTEPIAVAAGCRSLREVA
ncbi:hypothetical protein ACF061_01110 [Streptomyces sp. NPDC015220]|uniref:hypothetical protein n=1 Tax=Streptomyces sp. NPDC015220 TaxID=3364947 RepID=UPI0036FE5BCC